MMDPRYKTPTTAGSFRWNGLISCREPPWQRKLDKCSRVAVKWPRNSGRSGRRKGPSMHDDSESHSARRLRLQADTFVDRRQPPLRALIVDADERVRTVLANILGATASVTTASART